MKPLIDCFHDRELVNVNGRAFIVNPLTEQIPATSTKLLRCACEEILKAANKDFDKVVGEEDKGGIIVAGVALAANKPFGMVRWYPSGLAGQVKMPFTSEYVDGHLYLNGIDAGDRVLVVDDMISTGGTMIGLIRALEKAEAEITDIVSVGEKVNYHGVDLIKEKTGYIPKTLIKIDISGKRSRVINIDPVSLLNMDKR
jgi:adenine/guanine phosphoribosyltransferase-like PRPP-binding protein